MKTSLTVVLPTHNGQATLSHTVSELLEILPELTSEFELVVVDDGSTDATRDVADDLMVRYPQLRLLVQPTALGPQEALRSAIKGARGEFLLLCGDVSEIDLHEVRKVWQRRQTEGAIYAIRETAATLGSIPKLPQRGGPAEMPASNFLLVPQRLLISWMQSAERIGVGAFLRSRGFSVLRVDIRGRARSLKRPAAMDLGRKGSKTAPSVRVRSRTDAGNTGSDALARRPTLLLAKLKALALGE